MSQPTDRSVMEGENARFDIAVNGEVALQWQSAPVGSNQWTDVDGANATSLLLTAVSIAESGTRYRVQVRSTRNAALVLVSTAVSLNVTQRVIPPVILQAPAPQSAVEGGNASFSVTASGTALSYQWMRGTGAASFADIPGATNATLVLSNLSLSDGDFMYRVAVSNSLQRIESSSAALTVTSSPVAPFFSRQPVVHAYVVAGQTASFTVEVVGVPTPTLQWQRSTDGATWFDLDGEIRASLLTGVLTLADNTTQYRVAATNTRGTVFSAVAGVVVSPVPAAPSISTQPIDVTSDVGPLVGFSVGIDGTPGPSVQWQVSVDGGATYTNVTGAAALTLQVPATLTDNGKRYRAVATNSVGVAESRGALLTVLPRPQVEFSANSIDWHPGEIEPWFTVAASGSGLSYQWAISGDQGQTFNDVPGETSSSYIHRQRANDRTNAVRVTVSNASGSAQPSTGIYPLRWRTVHPQPIGDRLHGLTWVDGVSLVAVGDQGSVWYSEDHGQKWRVVAEGGWATSELFAVAYNGASNLVAVGRSGLLRRGTGAGRYWEGARQINGVSSLHGVAFVNENTVIAVGSQAGGAQGAIYRSTDMGLNWSAAIDSDEAPPLNSVAFSESGIGLVVGNSGQIMRSINDGAQWLTVLSGTNQYLSSVVWVSATTAVVAGSGGTILRSTDAGLTWRVAPTEGYTGFINSLDIVKSGQGTALTREGIILRTVDGGASWHQNPVVPAFDSAVKFSSDGKHAVSVGWSGLVRRSVDGGATWSINPHSPVEMLFGVAFADANQGVAVGADGRMLRTTNGGDDWSVLPSADRQLQGIAFADSSTGVAVGIDGLVLRTGDGGVSWAPVLSGSTQSLTAVAFAAPSVGVITSTFGMLRTTDGGRTWTRPSGDLPTYLLGVAFADANVGLAVGPGGEIRRSVDGGQNWTSVASGTTQQLQSVCFADSNTAYAAGWDQTYLRSNDAGVSWIHEPGFSSLNMYGVACKAGAAVAVGDFARIDLRFDQGQGPGQWNSVGLSKGDALLGISLIGTGSAVGVGSGGLIVKLRF